ncbi:MAG: hypothetical protein HDR88_02010 [Bacteroides sp.]|nr:hypothetical protein [Bacteroides sp.]
MKHLLTTAFLCGASVLAMQAQNIVITDKDGVQHKFNADYVQEITFEKVQSGNDTEMVFQNVFVTTYGNQNISLTFSNEEDMVVLDLWQPAAFFLQEGTYKGNDSNDDFTLDPTYSKVAIDGNESRISDGTLTITRDGELYSFVGEVTYPDGTLKFTCEDTLNTFGPIINFNLSGCAYLDVNDPAANGFYYRFNDSDWNLEMDIDLFSDGNAPAPGVYTFEDTKENGTASSYVHVYKPFNEVTKFVSGTVTISVEGADTVVEIDGTLGVGVQLKAKYSGQLPEKK